MRRACESCSMFGSYLVRPGERPADPKMRYPVVDSSFPEKRAPKGPYMYCGSDSDYCTGPLQRPPFWEQ